MEPIYRLGFWLSQSALSLLAVLSQNYSLTLAVSGVGQIGGHAYSGG